MCIAFPGKIVKIEEGIATVDYGEETRKARAFDDTLRVGDYVIVQNQIIIQKIPKEEAEAFIKMVKDGA